MQLSIIIPCYNEEQNIPILIKNIIDTYQSGTEIILVNNGSQDNTKAVLLKEIELAKGLLIRTINIKNNIGYGHGIMSGVSNAKGEIIAWTHADLQTDISDVYNGYKIFIEQPDIKKIFLKGNRKKRPFFDHILTWGMGKISSRILGQKFKDINAQPKMFHQSFLHYLNNAPDDFSLDLYFYFLALKKGMTIIELPVYFKDRLYGEAKGGGGSSIWTRIKVIRRTLKYINDLKKQQIIEKMD